MPPPDPYYPWRLTLRQLLAQVVRLHGDEQGRRAVAGIRFLAERRGIDDHDVVEPEVARYLIRRVGLLDEDFALDPDSEKD